MSKIKVAVTIAFLASMLIMAGAVVGQQTMIYLDEDLAYKKGLELFNKEKYAAAQKCFRDILQFNHKEYSEVKVNSEYYGALCAVNLFNSDAEELLHGFIRNNPESPKIQRAFYYLGAFKFRKKKYKDAIEWYEKVDVYDLTNEEIAEYYFKLGYSYFESEKLEEASKMFFEIKDVENSYQIPAGYYFSHIAYQQKKYETALTGMLKLTNDENFSSLVPYYIAQIYFLQKRYEDVIEYAPALLDSSTTKRAPEIARLIGESYYNLKKFKESIPFLLRFEKANGSLSPSDNYQLGYAFYKTEDFNRAIDYFKESSLNNDKLAQSSTYLIADCYVQTGNKNFARSTFKQVLKYDFEPDIKEDAHFNYAKLTYELSYHPFNEAIDAFQSYLKEYEGRARSDEAYKYMLNAFLTTKNYKDAIVILEAIKKKTKDIEYAYQKVSYYRGVELYNAGQFQQSIGLFNKSLEFPLDKNITSQCYYWKGDALYHLKDFSGAIKNYKVFLFEPGAAAQSEYFTSNYNLGYAYFSLKEYTEAISWFRKYATVKPIEDHRKHTDALLRIGDAYFINRDFNNAADYYSDAASGQGNNADYALFQRAISLGLVGKFENKMGALEEIIKKHPNSQYVDDSKFEIASTFHSIGETDQALKFYKMLVSDHPNSSYVSKALIKQGLIYYNEKEDEQALVLLTKVIKNHSNSSETQQALPILKNIYVSNGRVAEYDNLIQNLNIPDIGGASLDSTYYESAEGLFMKGECEKAIKSFKIYLEKYPEGAFSLHANFYLGECLFKMNFHEEALDKYKNVIARKSNVFTERALIKASKLEYVRKHYSEALEYFLRLELIAELPVNIAESRIGIMRCRYYLGDLKAANEAAKKVVLTDNIPSDVLPEANIIMAKQALQNSDYDVALSKFQLAAANSKNEIGAEAKYYEAYVKFLQKNYKESEKSIFEFGERFSYYDYWLAKSFILLSDNYLSQGDAFQAKATLSSIIENYEGVELKSEAQQKLDTILESEKPKLIEVKDEPVEIDFNDPTIYDNKLFEEE